MQTKIIVQLGPDAQKKVADRSYAMYTPAADMFVAGVVSWVFHRGFVSTDDFIKQVQERVRHIYPEVNDMAVKHCILDVFKMFYNQPRFATT